MKEIKAFIRSHRIAAVIDALRETGHCGLNEKSSCRNLSVFAVKGVLKVVDAQEQHYSIELGQEVINEFKLELLCEDQQADDLVEIIRSTGRTGQPEAGWIYVTDILNAVPIGAREARKSLQDTHD